jgi:hypothetical protein
MTDANRYWEGRWRDEKAENERLKARISLLRIALRGIEIYAYSLDDAKGTAAKAVLDDDER